MNHAGMAEAYKAQQILTASPEQLTLLLYNGAIRFVKESIQGLEEKQYEKAHHANMRAQDIVKELMCTLDMQYEISQNYYALYDYLVFRLMQGNIKKDAEQLLEAKEMLTELRDAWGQAMKLARQSPVKEAARA